MVILKFLAIVILILIVFLLIIVGIGYLWFMYQANRVKNAVEDQFKEGFIELIKQKYKESKNK